VWRDNSGTLQVWGATRPARAFGLGYGHGDDRLLPMFVSRIVGLGRAAELLQGTDAFVAQDRWMRRRGIARGAEQDVAKLSAEGRELVDAYCAGVNLRLSEPGQRLELTLLGLREEPWTPRDCLLMVRLLGYLSLSQPQEVVGRLVAGVAAAGTDADLAVLRAAYAPHLDDFDAAPLRGPGPPVRLVPPDMKLDPLCSAALPALAGSNAWAIPAERSTTGHALLANDPHLEGQTLPPSFYEACLAGPDGTSVGITSPGLPAVLAGRFDGVAAAVTSGFLDQIDFFVEECREGACRRGTRWEPLIRRDEVIERKGGKPETITVWSTERGTLEGDPRVPGRYLSRAWAPDRWGVASALDVWPRLERAQTLDDARDALAVTPLSMTWVVADARGAVGLQQGGLAPVRPRGRSGLGPVAGWDPANDWGPDPVPTDELARLDPEAGLSVTANDGVGPVHGRTLVTAALPGWRRRRIEQLLGGSRKVSPRRCEAAWLDVRSLRARMWMRTLRRFVGRSGRARTLRNWTGDYGAKERGPVLFERVRAALLREAYGPLFDRAAVACDPPDPGLTEGLDVALDADRLWLEANAPLVQGRGFEELVLDRHSIVWEGRDFEAAVRRAIARGLTPPSKPWRQAQRHRRSWLLVGGSALAELGIASRMRPLPGGDATVLQGRPMRTAGRVVALAPLWRMLCDLGEDGARTALAGGPSDRPGSRWYLSGQRGFDAGRLKLLTAPRG